MNDILFYQGDRPVYEYFDSDYWEEIRYQEYLKEEEKKRGYDHWFHFYLFPVHWWDTEATKYCQNFNWDED